MVEDEHPSWSYVGLQVVSGRLVQLWIACGVLWVLSEELEVLLWTEFGIAGGVRKACAVVDRLWSVVGAFGGTGSVVVDRIRGLWES